MRNILVPILLVISFSAPGTAAESGASVDVTVEYSSMFPGFVQIKDEVCALSAYPDCEKARIRLQSEDCRREPSPKCREAGEFLATSFCIPGLIYEGAASQGDRVTVSVCKSPAGFGSISVRNPGNGVIWTRYFLISDGSVVKFP